MQDEMMIPHYIMVLIPILTVWWTHRRGGRQEYWILLGSILVVCASLLVYSRFHHMICTRYDAPLAAAGIFTTQLPLSIFVTASVAAIPMKWKLVRNFLAILIGEILLVDTWIS
jgi:hypothetical protein